MTAAGISIPLSRFRGGVRDATDNVSEFKVNFKAPLISLQSVFLLGIKSFHSRGGRGYLARGPFSRPPQPSLPQPSLPRPRPSESRVPCGPRGERSLTGSSFFRSWENNADPESQRGVEVLWCPCRWILHGGGQAGRKKNRIRRRHLVRPAGTFIPSWVLRFRFWVSFPGSGSSRAGSSVPKGPGRLDFSGKENGG